MAEDEILLSRGGVADDTRYWPEATGASSGDGVTAVQYTTAVSAPQVSNGVIQHPYAQQNSYGSSYGSSVAGVLAGVSLSQVSAPLITNGEVVLPYAQQNNYGSSVAGMIAGVRQTSTVSAPMIQDGVMLLPTQSSGDGVTAVQYTTAVSAPQVSNGVIQHPYAQQNSYGSSYGSSVAGVLAGVQYGGTTGVIPIIQDGVVMHPYAQQNEQGSSVAGIIAGIATSAVSAPMIQNGMILLPQSSGAVQGVRDEYGNAIAWDDLYTDGAQVTRLATFGVNTGQAFTLCANYSGGYLNFEFRENI